ncbi:MAG: efflux RND transporter periplasmic adaptor subunit, partial [Candidatus Eisenbacteria bacterium]
MKKRVVLVALGVVVAMLVWRAAAKRNVDEGAYRFVEVSRGDLVSVVSSTGTLQATTTVEVGTQVSGIIAEIYVDFNDRVAKDQLIARIDPALLELEVRTAEASVDKSRAELEQAKRDLDRTRLLYDGQAATESEYSAAEYTHAAAAATRRSAEVNLERARRNLAYTEIRAPISGVVLNR